MGVRACGPNEVVRMGHLTKFFDKDRKNKIGLLSSDKQRSLMECIFDDTVIEAPKKNEGLKKGKSGMLEAMFMNAWRKKLSGDLLALSCAKASHHRR